MQRIDLKRIRKDKKLTQTALSQLTGYPQGFISQMETGKEAIPNSFIEKLEQKLDLGDIEMYMYEDSSSDQSYQMSNSCHGKNAKWQNGTSEGTIIRFLDMVDRKDAQLEKANNKIDELTQRIHELEAQIRELKK
jgi:transcriptional regulator with XRE-family HTH domain